MLYDVLVDENNIVTIKQCFALSKIDAIQIMTIKGYTVLDVSQMLENENVYKL